VPRQPTSFASPRCRRPPPTIRNLRWWIGALLMGATLVSYLDRTCLAVAAPELKAKFGITEVDYSRIVGTFQVSYLLMQPIAGRMIDWLGVRVGLAISIAGWSLAQMLTGLSSGWRTFAFFRGLLGIGEAGNFPAAAKVVSEWFPPRERTMATAIVNVGSGIGQAVAAPVVVYLLSRYDWRVAFVSTGAVGSIWVALWALLYRPPREHPRVSAGERALLAGEPAPVAKDRADEGAWRIVLRDRNFWALAGARFLSDPAWQFFSYWIPLYLASERHMKLRDIGYFAWMPFVAADAGCLFGGALSPVFMRLGSTLITARKLSTTVCAVLMVFAIFIGSAKSVGGAIAFFCIAAFAHQAMSSTLLTLPADLFPPRAVATANGLSGAFGGLGGVGFTMIVGVAVTRVGYAPIFVAIALFDLVGSAGLWGFLRDPTLRSLPRAFDRKATDQGSPT
jgi:MFS transporter, ACS family, hexuronate transporter